MLKDGRIWPFIIVGLLSISVVANVILLIKATGDPAFAVERDYYQKAVDFDKSQAAQARSDALGWKIELTADREQVQVRLFDAEGHPIGDAEVKVEAFHNARAANIISADLQSEGAGLYAYSGAFSRPGIWEYRLVAKRGEQRFAETVRKELP